MSLTARCRISCEGKAGDDAGQLLFSRVRSHCSIYGKRIICPVMGAWLLSGFGALVIFADAFVFFGFFGEDCGVGVGERSMVLLFLFRGGCVLQLHY